MEDYGLLSFIADEIGSDRVRPDMDHTTTDTENEGIRGGGRLIKESGRYREIKSSKDKAASGFGAWVLLRSNPPSGKRLS